MVPTNKVSKPRVPAEIKAFLAAYDPAVREIALETRAVVLSVVPDALEQIDVSAKMLAYGFAATYKDLICVIMPQKAYVNLGLPRGATLPDPSKLLEGTGKKARHVKLKNANRVEAPEIRALIRASVAQIKK